MASKWNSLGGRKSPPPFLPLNWLDWEADEHVQQMNETMRGVYLAILIELWKYDLFEFNYSTLADRLKLHDQRNARKFLEQWGHLFRCVECGKVPLKATGAKPSKAVSGPCSTHVYGVLIACSYCAHALSDPCLCPAPYVLNEKLKNYKNNADSGLSAETIQHKQIKPYVNPTTTGSSVDVESKPTSTSPVTGGKTKLVPVDEATPASPVEPTVCSVPDITDMTEWNEDRFGIPAERLRNCLIYQLEFAKNDYFREDPPTPASMNKEKFVRLIHERTPPNWSRETHKEYTRRKPKAAVAASTEPSKYQPKESI